MNDSFVSGLRLTDYDYDLPADRIATEPASPRDSSRLLVITRESGARIDASFRNLADHLRPSDVLVLNNTRVLKARLPGFLEPTGRPIEILFTRSREPTLWEAMLRPSRRIRLQDRIRIDDAIVLEVETRNESGAWGLRLRSPQGISVGEVLEEKGLMPIPPYIRRAARPEDASDYQTIFARHEGAIAAPTAGLHFTAGVIAELQARGMQTVEITLHVGAGTFVPVRTSDPRNHRLSPERYAIPPAAAAALNEAHAAQRRIVAVGTTVTRTLEYIYARNGRFVPETGETDLYILPGHQFRAVGALLTNFHLPKSTLLLLVAAFAGRDLTLASYRHAIDAGYRFYSFGDCCLWL